MTKGQKLDEATKEAIRADVRMAEKHQYWTQGAEYEYQGQKKHYKNICLLKPAF